MEPEKTVNFSRLCISLPLLALALASCATNYSSMSAAMPVVSGGGQFDVSGFVEPAGLDLHADYSPIDPLFIGASGMLQEGWSPFGEGRFGVYHAFPMSDGGDILAAGWAAYGAGRIHQVSNQGEFGVGGPNVLDTGNADRRSLSLMIQVHRRDGFHFGFEARVARFRLTNGVRTYLADSAQRSYYPAPQDISGQADFFEKYFVLGFPADSHLTFDLQVGLPTLLSTEPPFGWNRVMIGLGLQYRYSTSDGHRP